jgi:mono/diheme cytochrome c family protein/nitrate reductase cytochrome c-type subunit
MAATDQTYRNQRTLDVVFGVSCLLMLLSVVWMFWQDYNREYKGVQREFRDVEEALNEHLMIRELPTPETVKEKRQAIADARKKLDAKRAELAPKERELMARRDIQDNVYRSIKADYDSRMSYYNIDVEHASNETDPGRRKELEKRVEAREKEVKQLAARLAEAQSLLDKIDLEIRDTITRPLDGPEQEVTRAEDNLKKTTAVFDRFAKATAQKRWKFGDTFRKLPIVDAFESPTKIKQLWLPDLTIDYGGFKDVPRYDRCVSCHLGVDRASFDKVVLESLTRRPEVVQKDLEKAQAEYNKLKDGEGAEAEQKAKEAEARVKALQKELADAQGMAGRLKQARNILIERAKTENLGFDPSDLPQDVRWLNLTPGQITQYAAHPRLDLFVDANSPHSMEKFGCTACHAGQGSATDFLLAAHTPANATQEEEWHKQYGWERSHFWDFPMLSSRFVESSCLKCHHQVTDLIRYGGKEEAPKLLRGYNLVREFGCFGCHEISGVKAGREVGPDLRLEPTPALEYLTPAEQDRAKSDPLNMPGTYRKVGPSLRRIAEKTSEDWTRKWIQAPRSFRPDTKMPHFYGLSNNTPDNSDPGAALPEDQKKFPATEIYSITHYLFAESRAGLQGKDTTRESLEKRLKVLESQLEKGPLDDRERKEIADVSRRLGDLALATIPTRARQINGLLTQQRALQERLQELYAKQANLKAKSADEDLPADEEAELKQAQEQLGKVTDELLAAGRPVPLAKEIVNEEGHPVALPAAAKDDAERKKRMANGRRLFTEKGCLACHTHEGTAKEDRDLGVPAVASSATFAPNLSRVAAKISPELSKEEAADPKKVDEARRRWLVQWIMNPNVYHPRTRMPITHLSAPDAASIAEWLLAQKVEGWDEQPPEKPGMQELVNLARVYLAKSPGMTRQDVEDFLPAQADVRPGIPDERMKYLPYDADERKLVGPLKDDDESRDKLLWYIGRKSITRLGCYGCHDVPGFESAKPIGTALNDWGKKDPDRIAFEDADVYVRRHYNIVKERNEPGHPNQPAKDWHAKDGKSPYEELFYQALEHHHREGFLNQKLLEPRSYDYERMRTWEDRLRMPQFRFARSHKKDGESDEAFAARQDLEEAEAREAVMAFILGLVAEPMPLKYLYQPNPDRLAEVKGRQVLDKFNCAGCHQISPGIYDFKPGKDGYEALQQTFQEVHRTVQKEDYVFAGHNAWVGQPQTAAGGRLSVQATQPRYTDSEELGQRVLQVRLADALRFAGNDGVMRNIPSGTPIPILPGDMTAPPIPDYGGAFTELMMKYQSKKEDKFRLDESGNSDMARSTLPPPLFREGERVQPGWLYGFLLNPPPVRPTDWMLLRMPKFNLSGEDARQLVNYFAGTSRQQNPGAGVSAEYLTVAQKDEDYWRHKTADYVARLKKDKKQYDARLEMLRPLWQDYLRRQHAEAEASLDAARQMVKDSPKETKEQKQRALDALEGYVKKLKKEVDDKDTSRLQNEWETRGAYAVDGYRLLTDRNYCIQCHDVGNLRATQTAQGPNLDLAHERLRPEWTLRWVSNPMRLYTYKPNMPPPFKKNDPASPALFVGSSPEQASLEQTTATRDVMMDLPHLSKLPGINTLLPPREEARKEESKSGGK